MQIDNVHYLTPKFHEFQPETIKNIHFAYLLCKNMEFGPQEAFSYLVQHALNLKVLEEEMISDETNRCSNVFKMNQGDETLMILKFAKKLRYNVDIFREFMLTRRFLNPLRVLTPNFVYAYHLIPARDRNGHHKAFYEFVNGKEMESMVRKLSPNDFAGILLQICLSLQIALEACLFTHYDFHASNIMLVEPKGGFSHTYYYYGKSFKVKCKYMVKIIDYGYSYAVGNGMGVKEPILYGASDLSHARIHSDIFSCGFDMIKLLGFTMKIINRSNNSKKFKCFDWLWKEYVFDRYKNMKRAKKDYYGIKYSDDYNNKLPGSIVKQLIIHNRDLCDIEILTEDPKHLIASPPEIFLSPFFPVKIGKYYNYYLNNSHLNDVYGHIMTLQHNWFKNIKLNEFIPPTIRKINDERVMKFYNILKELSEKLDFDEGNMTKKIRSVYIPHINRAIACLLRLSELNRKDWRVMKYYRKYYKPIAYINTDKKIQFKEINESYRRDFNNDIKNDIHISPPMERVKKQVVKKYQGSIDTNSFLSGSSE